MMKKTVHLKAYAVTYRGIGNLGQPITHTVHVDTAEEAHAMRSMRDVVSVRRNPRTVEIVDVPKGFGKR